MSKLILVVDDSPSMRQLIGVTLRAAGYTVIETSDGQEALDYARKHAVDLVLTDVNMPHMDGITLVAHLRTLTNYYLVPLLLLTWRRRWRRWRQRRCAAPPAGPAVRANRARWLQALRAPKRRQQCRR